MKRGRAVPFATWLVERFTFGLHSRALAGDLLEELQHGRSAWWYWRQVCLAIAVGVSCRLRDCLLPLLFSAAWASFFPAWSLFGKTALARAIPAAPNTLAWPYSALFPLGYGIMPAITFVWFGFLIYLLLHRAGLRQTTAPRILLALSASLNVLLVSTNLLLRHFKAHRIDLNALLRTDFYSGFQVASISIPIALSLLAALSFTLARTPRPAQKQPSQPARRATRIARLFCIALILVRTSTSQQANTIQNNSGSPTVQFVTVAPDVKLEVLDWGGSGQPLIFLAGLGNDAHVFDSFAPQFTAHHHVYGITRRGFGASSKPAPDGDNYSADRLGDDVLAVMTALKLERPVLVGHSLAGEELSSIASRFPERVAGLIYLDAAYGYAYYDKAHGDTIFDFFQLKKQLDAFTSGRLRDPEHAIQEMSAATSAFDRDLTEAIKRDPSVPELHPRPVAIPPIVLAINLGGRKYSNIPVPVLAIFACPHNFDFDRGLSTNPTLKAQVEAEDTFTTSRQADAFEAGVPSAHVVRLANADHYVFRSNEADVFREMNAFLSNLH